jgi:hypothetical protein
MLKLLKSGNTQKVLLLLLLFNTVLSLYYQEKLKQVQTENMLKSKRSVALAYNIARLAKEIRIATYPTPCDALTKEIVGESCDLGNYMEWAGPHLENETEKLLLLLRDSQR